MTSNHRWLGVLRIVLAVCTAVVGLLVLPDLLGVVLCVTALVTALAGWVFPTRTEGASMWPTLAPTTFGVVVAPPLVALRRGDLVYVVPTGFRPLVKRLVALPGDVVRAEGGTVWVGGRPVSELGSRLPVDLSRAHDPLPVELTCDGAYLLGDHLSSRDSRHLGTFPLAAIRGRYHPLLQWGRPRPTPLSPTDARALEAARAGGPRPALALLEDALRDGAEPFHLRVLLVGALEGDARLDLLRRLRVEDGHHAPWWSARLGRLLADQGRFEDLLRELEVDLPPDSEHHATVTLLRSIAATRLGRWEEGLRSAILVDPDGEVLVPSRLVALLGLARTGEAQALVERWTREGTWGDEAVREWYAGYVAAAEGRFDEAARHLVRALDLGFDDPAALRTHPLLARLRADVAWTAVAARLNGPPAE